MTLIASVPACALMLAIAALALRRALMSNSRNWIRYVAVVALSFHGIVMALFVTDDATGRVATAISIIVLAVWLLVRTVSARRRRHSAREAGQIGLAPLL